MASKAKPPYELTNERKLTDQDVLVIRLVHIPKSPYYGSVVLAALYNVSQPTIDNAVHRRTYRHLHPLLLPAGDGGSFELSDSTEFTQATTKTAYRAAQNEQRRWFKDLYSQSDLLRAQGKKDSATSDWQVPHLPIKRRITPEAESARRAKLREHQLRRIFGDAYDPNWQAAELPKLTQDEWELLKARGVNQGPNWTHHDEVPPTDETRAQEPTT